MSRVFRYGLYGVGRIGRVHGQIVKDQGHVIAAIGDDSRAAVEEASRLDPTAPAVGLEAGVIAILDGREEAARSSWQSVIELSPGTEFATSAQTYLDQLGPAEQ